MRSLRVSPLVRRASPSGCVSNSRSSDDTSKGLARPNSTSCIEGERKCGAGGELLVPADLNNHFLQRRRSHPGRGQTLDTESPLSAVSTPTRNSSRSADAIKDDTIPDADRVHEKLQQMWDDGELSPRAPLDRSLGYISSSPNSSGKGASGSSVTPESAGGAQSCRQNPQQQGAAAPLFINDVRALRQMAPFSSTEEQVLTRSQRRRSSANLLQQLVAAQSCGSTHQGQREASLQQEQGAIGKEQQQQRAAGFQKQSEHCDISDGQQQHYQTQTVVAALDLSTGQACGFNSFAGADALSRGIGARKRRASSPVVSTDSFSPQYRRKSDSNLPADGVPQPTGRKRLSALRTSTQTLITADATPATSKESPRRNSATSAVPYNGRNGGERDMFDITINCTSTNSSRGTIESPFQKHPPPSPSDFPVSSPINTGSYSPQRNVPAEPKLQAHQLQVHSTSAVSGRPPLRGPLGKEKQALGSPLRTSPRRTHGEGGASCSQFQTPRGPCSSLEPQEDATGASVRQRASQRCLSPLPLLSTGTPNKRAAAEQRGDGPLSREAREKAAPLATADAHGRVRAIAIRAPSTLKSAVTSRRASAAPASRFKEAPGSSNASIVPLTSNRQAEAAKGMTETLEMCKAPSSPRKTETPGSNWHRPGRPGAASPRMAASERQCKSQLTSATSPKHLSDRTEKAAPEPHTKCRCPSVREPGDIPPAAAATRRRSAARRSIGLTSSMGPSSSWVPTSLSDRRSPSVSPVASQDVTDQPSVLITARSPMRLAKAAATQERKAVARLVDTPFGAATQSSVASQNNLVDACVGASQGDRCSTRASAAGKATTVGAVRKGLSRAPPPRHPAGKPRASSGKGLFHNATARSGANVLPITKPRILIRVPEKQKGVNRITVSCRPAGGAVRGLRNSRGKLPASSSCPRGISGVASSRQGRPAVKCHSSTRMKAEVQVSDSAEAKSSGASATGCKVDAKDNALVAKGGHNEDLRSKCQSQSELSSASNEISERPTQSERPHLNGTDEDHRKRCMKSAIGCSVVSSAHSAAGVGVPASAAGAALTQSSFGNVTAHPPSRRRSSSPHSLALQKFTSNDGGDDKLQYGNFTSLRRASSACSLEDGDGRRVSEQQQRNEALRQEWEGRDREYQERQQKLLQEQQRRERLLAWEQREAELLKNRKALSKEEPSFWGFDPFMVDEEDEKVLTTEELRVEVSRFLKGDLRFHSRADLLRVVKKFSEQTRTTTTTTSSRLNFAKVDQRVVPMAARQVHGTVPHERRRKSILRNSSTGPQQSTESRRRSRGISFSPFNKVQLYMLDEHERASKEAAAHLSQQGEQRQQLRQKLAHQFQLMLLRGDSDLELALIRRELANLYDPDDEDSIAFLSPTLAPGRDGEADSRESPNPSQQGGADAKLNEARELTNSVASDGSGLGRLPFTVSPSWRQRPHNVWQETPGASQTEPCAEWSPPPSPIEPSRLNTVGDKDGNGCWETPIDSASSAIEGKRELNRSENDENTNCNATQSPAHLNSAKELSDPQDPVKELSVEGPPKLFASEATRRPSVLSRRLSVVPNA
ncbi:Proteophosphoglycan 5, related [Eimeria mitis]|uniref:Proteophosphoglycan 5, related n=1 Tax=Eimeria mitis TaxID=44415 RepID=U6KIN9_9EIME|nr:Proteophosphoglycan 5, related [Eimeria mitis]CDJ36671.1 Proteophosphoglycan 5, related [Eimeria mitis]